MRRYASVIALLCLVSLSVGPADAATRRFDDGRRDSRTEGLDIQRIKVGNFRRVVVTSIHRDLNPRSASAGGIFIWLDTERQRGGPEFVIEAGASRDVTWHIWRADGWRSHQSVPLSCSIERSIQYRTDRLRISIGSDCIDEHQHVRVSAMAYWTDTSSGDHDDWRTYRDYAPARRQWTRSVRRG